MIYTDGIHLVADTLEELHEFANKIGLKRHFYEGVRKGHPHYDLTNERIKQKSIEEGAVLKRKREILVLSKALSKTK